MFTVNDNIVTGEGKTRSCLSGPPNLLKLLVNVPKKVEGRLKLLPLTVKDLAKLMQVSARQTMVNPLLQAETTSALTSK